MKMMDFPGDLPISVHQWLNIVSRSWFWCISWLNLFKPCGEDTYPLAHHGMLFDVLPAVIHHKPAFNPLLLPLGANRSFIAQSVQHLPTDIFDKAYFFLRQLFPTPSSVKQRLIDLPVTIQSMIGSKSVFGPENRI